MPLALSCALEEERVDVKKNSSNGLIALPPHSPHKKTEGQLRSNCGDGITPPQLFPMGAALLHPRRSFGRFALGPQKLGPLSCSHHTIVPLGQLELLLQLSIMVLNA